jgi:hypothetical protein
MSPVVQKALQISGLEQLFVLDGRHAEPST